MSRTNLRWVIVVTVALVSHVLVSPNAFADANSFMLIQDPQYGLAYIVTQSTSDVTLDGWHLKSLGSSNFAADAFAGCSAGACDWNNFDHANMVSKSWAMLSWTGSMTMDNDTGSSPSSYTHRRAIGYPWYNYSSYRIPDLGNYRLVFRQTNGTPTVYTSSRVCNAVCGDYNLDGVVNGADGDLVNANWGGSNRTFMQGDCHVSDNGTIDATDLNYVTSRMNKVCAMTGQYCLDTAGMFSCVTD